MSASTHTSAGRALLLAAAGALVAAAALAIATLLFGDFGGTEGRILITTLVLAGHGVLAVPAALLRDRARLPWLAFAAAALVSANATLNVAAVWWSTDSEALGKVIGTSWALVVATVVTSALAARRRRHRLFLPSIASAYAAALLLAGGLWTATDADGYFRVVGALVVLTALLVALQPLLLRARRERVPVPVRVVDESGSGVEVVVEAESAAEAVARAVGDAERRGTRVRSVELLRR